MSGVLSMLLEWCHGGANINDFGYGSRPVLLQPVSSSYQWIKFIRIQLSPLRCSANTEITNMINCNHCVQTSSINSATQCTHTVSNSMTFSVVFTSRSIFLNFTYSCLHTSTKILEKIPFQILAILMFEFSR